ACSGSKVFRRKSTVLRYSSGSTDNVGYILKQLGRQGYGSSRRLRWHLRPHLIFPNLAQLFERRTKQLQRIVDVQHILRLLFRVAVFLDQQLLDDEAQQSSRLGAQLG